MIKWIGKAECSYDVWRISDDTFRETIFFTEKIESNEFKTEAEAKSYYHDNDKDVWGDDSAKLIAVHSAVRYVGSEYPEEPLTTDTVTGNSLEARNIKGTAVKVETQGEEEKPSVLPLLIEAIIETILPIPPELLEKSELPGDVKKRIERLQREKKKRIADIKSIDSKIREIIETHRKKT